ncbi:glyoxalase superfamily protein [Occallatibacter riparius]|uniref:Glyoxalase superfamily protein n=1 Tax=Occallatibacter riparius TaxID=1002689 RepID=A0A9J7BRC1_9BACT|nr:glyoxalase superfamily protein [Occallatibacter riparius]UWZ84306.1 glyoxalase superfamily protein [Occallatibacter riparius]
MARITRVAPELPVSNLGEAIAFYGRLGFALASQSAEGYAILERDGIALHLFEDKLHRSAAMGVHLFTPDLAEMYEEFAGRGVQFSQGIERKPWGNRDFRVKDAFGNELKFTEPLGDDE